MGEVIIIGMVYFCLSFMSLMLMSGMQTSQGLSQWFLCTLIADIPCRVFPEWKVYSEFVTEHWNRALDLDAKKSSHPIEVECPDENQINQVCRGSRMRVFWRSTSLK